MANNNVNDVAMTWDDEIQNDGEGFRVLPEGEYDFVVEDFSRSRYDGPNTSKPCPQAELRLRVSSSIDSGIVSDSIILNRKYEWKMCRFFIAIGDRKHGEALRPNWPGVIGKKGRCKITIYKYISKKDGKEHEANNVEYLDPPESAAPPQGAAAYTQPPLTSSATPRQWTGGQF